MASDGAKLPQIDGFLLEDRPGIHRHGLLAPRMRNMFVTILGCKHFSRRADTSSTRFYTNLVVLYRVLLFYGDLRATPSFWNHVRNDWGLAAAVPDGKVATLVNYFTDARLRSKGMGDTCPETLLMRLAARWAGLRGGGSRATNVDNAWTLRRAAWAKLRDTALNTLLDPNQVLCPLEAPGVQPQAGNHQPQPKLTTSHGYYHPQTQTEDRLVPTLAEMQPTGPYAAVPAREQEAWVPNRQLVDTIPRVRINAEDEEQEQELPTSSMAGDETNQDRKMTELHETMRLHAPMFMGYLQRRQQEEQQQRRHRQRLAVQGGEAAAAAAAAAAAMTPLGDPSAARIRQLARRIEHLEERLDEEMTHAAAAGCLSDDANQAMLQRMWAHIAAIIGDAEAIDMAREY